VVAPRTLAGAVRDAGCDVVPFARAPERTQSSPSILGRVGTLTPAVELARASPQGAYAAQLLDALDTQPADVLVIDFMLADAIAAAQRTRVPTAALMHTVYCLPGPGRLPSGPV
jgi:hypothetical protein